MIFLLVSLFLGNIPSFAFSASSQPKINCLIINLDYVNCTWTEHEHRYIFKSMFTHKEILDCPEYLRIDGVNTVCKFPYIKPQRFNDLITWLYSDNGSLVTEQKHMLKEYVKLNPPFNLSVMEKKDTELWLYWNNSKNDSCIESEVRHRTDNNPWKNTTPSRRTTFSLPFPAKKRYEFQVRARIESSCGESKFWSDWSEPVYWGSLKTNDTSGGFPMSVMSLVLCTAGATVILIILSCLLVHSERLRIILIPVVPNAGRNVSKYLAALFDNYDGNVEKWLSMPKDLENGFKPNFTERACPVREYRTVSQSSTDSESILSNPTDLSSDYQCMHSYSSASTIPGSSETIQPQDLSQVDNPV
ncbi:cytokine receptor common subunit gamma-like [Carassius auratus]|uniref:Cytokine receptor common subunit gamma-like n=1 Tax=Carassius auratus TaxID=7957 RepID=A0A6P6QBY7_CARAU|nr:cytokine receptor common subunit gamma-like [Carassius auratus]XP_026129632.1 cytokine receptor common subunit gamma-like [Carassius auratus]XP_052423386.1 interleukin 2 receptor, gamma a [Carassius gibelio]